MSITRRIVDFFWLWSSGGELIWQDLNSRPEPVSRYELWSIRIMWPLFFPFILPLVAIVMRSSLGVTIDNLMGECTEIDEEMQKRHASL